MQTTRLRVPLRMGHGHFFKKRRLIRKKLSLNRFDRRHDLLLLLLLGPDDDVVDGDVDELDEEPDEPHDTETNRGGDSDLAELLPGNNKL